MEPLEQTAIQRPRDQGEAAAQAMGLEPKQEMAARAERREEVAVVAE